MSEQSGTEENPLPWSKYGFVDSGVLHDNSEPHIFEDSSLEGESDIECEILQRETIGSLKRTSFTYECRHATKKNAEPTNVESEDGIQIQTDTVTSNPPDVVQLSQKVVTDLTVQSAAPQSYDDESSDSSLASSQPAKDENQLKGTGLTSSKPYEPKDLQKIEPSHPGLKPLIIFSILASILLVAIIVPLGFWLIGNERNRQDQQLNIVPVPAPALGPGSSECPRPNSATETVHILAVGMDHWLNNQELSILEDAFKDVYNEITGGCRDIYSRHVTTVRFARQTLGRFPDNNTMAVNTDLDVQLQCDGCPPIQPLFDKESPKSAISKPNPRAKSGTIRLADFLNQLQTSLDKLAKQGRIRRSFGKISEGASDMSEIGLELMPTTVPSMTLASVEVSRGPSQTPSRTQSMQPSSRPFETPPPQEFESTTPISVTAESVSFVTQIEGIPSSNPSPNPSLFPSSGPSFYPTFNPSSLPSKNPSNVPSSNPSTNPTFSPSTRPTDPLLNLASSNIRIVNTASPSKSPEVLPSTPGPTRIFKANQYYNRVTSSPSVIIISNQRNNTASPSKSPTETPRPTQTFKAAQYYNRVTSSPSSITASIQYNNQSLLYPSQQPSIVVSKGNTSEWQFLTTLSSHPSMMRTETNRTRPEASQLFETLNSSSFSEPANFCLLDADCPSNQTTCKHLVCIASGSLHFTLTWFGHVDSLKLMVLPPNDNTNSRDLANWISSRSIEIDPSQYNKSIFQGMSPMMENVHFAHPVFGRYAFLVKASNTLENWTLNVDQKLENDVVYTFNVSGTGSSEGDLFIDALNSSGVFINIPDDLSLISSKNSTRENTCSKQSQCPEEQICLEAQGLCVKVGTLQFALVWEGSKDYELFVIPPSALDSNPATWLPAHHSSDDVQTRDKHLEHLEVQDIYFGNYTFIVQERNESSTNETWDLNVTYIGKQGKARTLHYSGNGDFRKTIQVGKRGNGTSTPSSLESVRSSTSPSLFPSKMPSLAPSHNTNSSDEEPIGLNMTLLGSIEGSVQLDGRIGGEKGISGVSIVLEDTMGSLIEATLTDGSGRFNFVNVSLGKYMVKETNLPGHIDIGDADGGDPNVVAVTLSREMLNSTGNNFIDAIGRTIEGHVLEDVDNDGDGETGVPGITVLLFNDKGIQVRRTLTDTNGAFLFDLVSPGKFALIEELSIAHIGVDDSDGGAPNKIAVDVTKEHSDGNIFVIEKTEKTQTTSRSGLMDTSSHSKHEGVVSDIHRRISGHVLEDIDHDGDGDSGVPGVLLLLFDNQGGNIGEKTTKADGTFLFESIPPGKFNVVEKIPEGYVGVSDSDGGNPDRIMVDVTSGDSKGNVFVCEQSRG